MLSVFSVFFAAFFVGYLSDASRKSQITQQKLDRQNPRGTFERLKYDLGTDCELRMAGDTMILTIDSSNGFSAGGTLREIQRDITNSLKTIRESGIDFDTVEVSAVTGLIDKFGNTHKDTTVYASYDRSLIEQINFDNFGPWTVLDITDHKRIHPALKE